VNLVDFIQLFAWPLLALFGASIAAPITGAFLVSRGTSFHGVALPQVAACGVAVGFALFPYASRMSWTIAGADDHGHVHGVGDPAHVYLGACATIFVIAALALFESRRASSADADKGAIVAATFAVASGGSALAAQLSPLGGLHVDALLSGETLSTGPWDAALLGVVALGTVLFTWRAWRSLTLAGLDPDFAAASGGKPRRSNLLLHAMTAAVVISGSLTVGALPMFALLVIPAMSLRRPARSMGGYLRAAPFLGLVSAILGAGIAFHFDLSMDASVVAGCAIAGLAARFAPRL
jgi:ABC-type Mn2+/Zn2+ transport system permease subunit